jgi:hypothetical protein
MTLLIVSAGCVAAGVLGWLERWEPLLITSSSVQGLALLGFSPLYLKNRAVMRRVQEQATLAEEHAMTPAAAS